MRLVKPGPLMGPSPHLNSQPLKQNIVKSAYFSIFSLILLKSPHKRPKLFLYSHTHIISFMLMVQFKRNRVDIHRCGSSSSSFIQGHLSAFRLHLLIRSHLRRSSNRRTYCDCCCIACEKAPHQPPAFQNTDEHSRRSKRCFQNTYIYVVVVQRRRVQTSRYLGFVDHQHELALFAQIAPLPE